MYPSVADKRWEQDEDGSKGHETVSTDLLSCPTSNTVEPTARLAQKDRVQISPSVRVWGTADSKIRRGRGQCQSVRSPVRHHSMLTTLFALVACPYSCVLREHLRNVAFMWRKQRRTKQSCPQVSCVRFCSQVRSDRCPCFLDAHLFISHFELGWR